MTPQPHDLIELTAHGARYVCADAPAWVRASIERAPWVVVRRERLANAICVGVRGRARNERFAATIDTTHVASLLTPEMLAKRTPVRAHPVFEALRSVRQIASSFGLIWGPAGAAGYELATSCTALHADSDLDLLVRAEPGDASLQAFAAQLRALPVRVDVELAFGDGWGAALEEALRGGELLVKTFDGPALLERAAR